MTISQTSVNSGLEYSSLPSSESLDVKYRRGDRTTWTSSRCLRDGLSHPLCTVETHCEVRDCVFFCVVIICLLILATHSLCSAISGQAKFADL